VLLAAAVLRIPARRIRALALGDESALRDWIVNESATRLAEARRDARSIGERLEREGARLIALGEADYPVGLRDLKDPPPFLIARGTLPRKSRWREGTAIVGTREPLAAAEHFARRLAALVAPPRHRMKVRSMRGLRRLRMSAMGSVRRIRPNTPGSKSASRPPAAPYVPNSCRAKR